MNALIYRKANQSIEHQIVEKPKPGPGEILVRVQAASVCGTDLHIICGQLDGLITRETVILGHEVCGIVEEFGPNVDAKYLSLGQFVGVQPVGQCFQCDFCRSGHYNYCDECLSDHLGYARDGGWAEWCCIPIERAFTMPHMPPDSAVLVEPMGCIVLGYKHLKDIYLDASVLILGGGIIGLLCASFFHFKGHKSVTISEPNIARKTLLNKLEHKGIECFSPEDLDQERFQDHFGVIVDCCGNGTALGHTITKNLMPSGSVLCLGLSSKEEKLRLSPFVFYEKEVQLTSAFGNCFNWKETIAVVHDMYKSGYLNLEKLGVKSFTLDDFKEALEQLRERSITKAVFTFQ